MRRSRWWRRVRDRPAPRCGWCGWHPPNAFGQVVGKHDPRFVGHAWCCPVRLYAGLRTAQGIEDQWMALGAWSRLPGIWDVPGADDAWARMTSSLIQRADMLNVPFPIADDASELAEVT